MEEGTVVEWKADVGTQVAEGDVIAVVATDKVDVDFESPVSGIIAEQLVSADETVPCGTPVVAIAKDRAEFEEHQG